MVHLALSFLQKTLKFHLRKLYTVQCIVADFFPRIDEYVHTWRKKWKKKKHTQTVKNTTHAMQLFFPRSFAARTHMHTKNGMLSYCMRINLMQNTLLAHPARSTGEGGREELETGVAAGTP